MPRLAQGVCPAFFAATPSLAIRRRRIAYSPSAFAIGAAILLASLTAAGCGGGDASGINGPPAPAPSQPAPASLQKTWVTNLPGSGERVTLTLGALSYQIVRGPNQASGVIAVTGDRIEFSGSSVCAGTGAYRWSITGGSLQFTSVATDACPGRSEVVAGITYTASA